MKFKLIPAICQGEDATYSGHVMIDVPAAPQRYKYIRDSRLLNAVSEGGDKPSDSKSVKFALSEELDFLAAMLGFIPKHIEEVALVRLSDGMEVKSCDELLSIRSCEPIAGEICRLFVQGFEPTKKSDAS